MFSASRCALALLILIIILFHFTNTNKLVTFFYRIPGENMASILVAGASGKVGQATLLALQQKGHRVRALVRDQARLGAAANNVQEIFPADARDPASLQGVCQNVEFVISSVGGSLQLGRTQPGAGYWEVDFQANKNLLEEARQAGVRKFIYVSAFQTQQIKGSAYFAAHAAFENVLKRSNLDYAIVRPTGMYYIFEEFIRLARRGIIPLFGDGSAKTNPIDEHDVARVCVEAMDARQTEYDVGGPEVFTRREISELCFRTLGKKLRFIKYPVGLMQMLIQPLRLFDQRLFDLMDFAILVNHTDCIAPRVGTEKLENYLKRLTAGV
jgi:uncharacterized protein YbjT (DUF2867 family)